MTTATEPARRPRDPEARRREILDAAAELVVEHGTAALTHRAVAGRSGLALGTVTRYFPASDELREATLHLLADESDAGVAEIAADLAEAADLPALLAERMSGFLRDRRQVFAAVALFDAAVNDAALRTLALRWVDRLVEALTPYVGAERALALEVYLDGATVHAALHDTPLDPAALTAAVRALCTMPAISPTTEPTNNTPKQNEERN